MANLCSNNMTITGPDEVLEKFYNKIVKQSPALILLFPWFEKALDSYGLWEDTLQYNEEDISLSFGSKWLFPYKEFGKLARKYKKLSFTGTYEEPAQDIFGEFSAETDSVSVTDMDGFDYYTKYDQGFAAELVLVKTMSYKKFLKHIQEYLENKEDNPDTFNLFYMEPIMLQRIKKEDLPLFLDSNWHDERLFTSTLKGE